MIKQLSGFSVIDFNGGKRVTYTYDEIDNTGNLVSSNNKRSFYAIDSDTIGHINSIMDVISNKMKEE